MGIVDRRLVCHILDMRGENMDSYPLVGSYEDHVVDILDEGGQDNLVEDIPDDQGNRRVQEHRDVLQDDQQQQGEVHRDERAIGESIPLETASYLDGPELLHVMVVQNGLENQLGDQLLAVPLASSILSGRQPTSEEVHVVTVE